VIQGQWCMQDLLDQAEHHPDSWATTLESGDALQLFPLLEMTILAQTVET
jgi:hypothetical protein